ncbi:hypothetical protein [Raoultella planticola]|nr:hypothetical protein [Raoultella planticola]
MLAISRAAIVVCPGEHAVSGKTCRYRGAHSRLLASAKRMV